MIDESGTGQISEKKEFSFSFFKTGTARSKWEMVV